MREPSEQASSGRQALVEMLGKGRPFRPEVDEGFARILGVPIGREGLSRVFNPGFPGIRAFVVEPQLHTDASLGFSVVGISRDGRPVWTARRIIQRGRDGSLEIHRGSDEIDPEFRSRNITSDLVRRELDLLAGLGGGRSARLTLDADGVGRFLCALHGFVFSDEMPEGPSLRSKRPRDRASDRARLIESARAFAEKLAARHSIPRGELESLERRTAQCQHPRDFALLDLEGLSFEVPKGEESYARPFGRAFLLERDTPGYRAALYVRDDGRLQEGEHYRAERTARSEARLAEAVQTSLEALVGEQRAPRIRALETIGALGPTWVLPEVRALTDDPDRRVATLARQVARLVSGGDLANRILAFAADDKKPPEHRAMAYRVVAEYFPGRLAGEVAMLRVHPDARIQRAIVPLVGDADDPAPDLGSMLGANPWDDQARPGLLELRLELIDRLAALADPRPLPTLIAALGQSPPPEESLALSRALIGHPDPRARLALTAATQSLDIPPVP